MEYSGEEVNKINGMRDAMRLKAERRTRARSHADGDACAAWKKKKEMLSIFSPTAQIKSALITASSPLLLLLNPATK